MSDDLCFVLVPSGATGDALYEQLLVPAIRAAGLEPFRRSETLSGTPALEQMLLCRFAVFDVTGADADVLYQVGARQAARPGSTVLVAGERQGRLPFGLEALPLDADALTARLQAIRKQQGASITELVDTESPGDVARLKTDVFRDRAHYSQSIKERLSAARRSGVDAVRAVERDMDLETAESAALIDLMLSYRAVEGWREMIALVERMPAPLAASIMVREQLAFGLNRAGEGGRAEALLLDILARHGPSSETSTLLGRVYKDRWERAAREGRDDAPAILDRAIAAYRSGFEADWRDAFPGINAVTLMELRDQPDPMQRELLPLVRYAVSRRIAGTQSDYWDHAALSELAVLAGDREAAARHLKDAVAIMREVWEGKSTARNLRLIAEARERRGQDVQWIRQLAQELPG